MNLGKWLILWAAIAAIPAAGAAQVLSVPVRWCVVADDANNNGRVDPGERGAPAFTAPATVGETDTDNVLWRRHERPSDNIFIPEAEITFRSGIYNIVEDPLLRFPIIPDPDPTPTDDAFWEYGDILDGNQSGAELNAAYNSCVDAWREQHGVEDIGIVVINANHYRDLSGDSGAGGAVRNSRRLVLRDNAYQLPGSPLNTFPQSDHVDKHFAHEVGHALAGLRHTCSNVNVMSNRRQDNDGDGLVDNFHLNASIAEVTSGGSDGECVGSDSTQTVNQIQLLRDAARAAPGCKIDGTNTDCTIRSDVRADRIRDAPFSFADLSVVTAGNTQVVAKLVHEPMGPLSKRFFRTRGAYIDYFTFLDQDRQAATGGSAEDLGVPIPFKGVDLATRVRVMMRDGRWRFIPTVWRHSSGAFAQISSRGIRAYGLPLRTISEKNSIHLTDQITLEMPVRLFGPATEFKLQAAVTVPQAGRNKVLDVLDDGRERAGRDFRWRSPKFPICSVTPGFAPRIGPFVTTTTGLLPNQPVHLIFGHRHIANGHTDANGKVIITASVPADARDGKHLITVGTDGTALTADCTTLVRGGRRLEPQNPRPRPGQTSTQGSTLP